MNDISIDVEWLLDSIQTNLDAWEQSWEPEWEQIASDYDRQK